MIQSKQQGFTLVELMVTLAIIGVVAGVGFAAMNNTVTIRDRVDHVKSFIQRIQNESITSRRDTIIIMQTTADSQAFYGERFEDDGTRTPIEAIGMPNDVRVTKANIAASLTLTYDDSTNVQIIGDDGSTVYFPSMQIFCRPTGKCDARTMFFRNSKNQTTALTILPTSLEPFIAGD